MSVLAYWNSLLWELKMITGDEKMKTWIVKNNWRKITRDFAVAEDGELISFLHKTKLSLCESHLPGFRFEFWLLLIHKYVYIYIVKIFILHKYLNIYIVWIRDCCWQKFCDSMFSILTDQKVKEEGNFLLADKTIFWSFTAKF